MYYWGVCSVLRIYFVLLNAFVVGYTVCKNMHGMGDIQIVNMSSPVWSKFCNQGIGVYTWMGRYVLISLEGASVRSSSLLAHIVGHYLSAFLWNRSWPIRRGASTWSVADVVSVFTKYHLQWAWHCVVFLHDVYVGEGRGVNRVLVGKPEGKRPLERPRRRWEDNIKIDLREVGGGGDWMELAQDRDRWRPVVNTVMNFRVP